MKLQAFPAKSQSADQRDERYCVSPSKPILAAPFVGGKICHPVSDEPLELIVQTNSGNFHNPEYYDLNRGARDDHSVSRVEVKNGKLIQTRLRRGRWNSLHQEFLTVCAQVPSDVLCTGPIDVFSSSQEGRGGKENHSLGPEVLDYSYRAQILDCDMLEFTPVKRCKSVDLTGKVKLLFP